MKLKKHFYPTFLLIICSTTLTQEEKTRSSVRRKTPHEITFFMRPYEMLPEYLKEETTHAQLVKDPYWVTKKFLNSKFNYATDPRGIYVMYAGFVDTVDVNRQVRFPRLTQENEITMIVTRKLTPVIIRGNTVEYFLRDKNYDIAYYSFKRIQDPAKKIEYWNVEKMDVPENKKLSPAALIIFAEPSHIVVPLGQIVATPGPNLVLPPIYANKGLEKDYNAMSFIKINNLFDPIEEVTKIAPQRYAQQIGNGS